MTNKHSNCPLNMVVWNDTSMSLMYPRVVAKWRLIVTSQFHIVDW